MAKLMKRLTVICAILLLIFIIIYFSSSLPVILSLCITFGTTFYHLFMRLFVGFCVNSIFHNKMDYNKRWFRECKFEKKLYRILKINKLKRIPTYSPDVFSTSLHTFEEIVCASCQAEVVHEIIFVLSYIPLLFTLFFGVFWVFFITSVIASLIDLFFVIIQRYKRPILVKFIKRHNAKGSK